MFQLAELKRELGEQGALVQGVFVTLDPERDSAEMLKAYVENFDPSFVALVPTLPELEAVIAHYKVYRKKSLVLRPPVTPWTTSPAFTSTTCKGDCACSADRT